MLHLSGDGVQVMRKIIATPGPAISTTVGNFPPVSWGSVPLAMTCTWTLRSAWTQILVLPGGPGPGWDPWKVKNGVEWRNKTVVHALLHHLQVPKTNYLLNLWDCSYKELVMYILGDSYKQFLPESNSVYRRMHHKWYSCLHMLDCAVPRVGCIRDPSLRDRGSFCHAALTAHAHTLVPHTSAHTMQGPGRRVW